MTSRLDAFNARTASALEGFAALLIEIAGISANEAAKVSAYYRRHKLAKVDAQIGRVLVKNGAFLDRDVILRAVAAA